MGIDKKKIRIVLMDFFVVCQGFRIKRRMMMICHLRAGSMMMLVMMIMMICHLMAGSRTKGTRKRKPKTQTMQRVPRKRLKILEM